MPARTGVVAAVLALPLLAASLTACGSDGSSSADALTVYAAASLKPTFSEIGQVYEREHPGSRVDFSFGGSNTLEQQISSGADADVFASANQQVMQRAVADGLTSSDPVDFTANALVIATPPDNPADITSFADLAGDGVDVVVCAPQVPCGSAALRAEDAAGVELHPVSEENNVTDVLGKVIAGQADAGLVYATDAQYAGDKVHTVDFTASGEAVNTYPIAVLIGASESGHTQAAQQFVDLVTGEQGQEILHRAGFR